MRRTTRLVSAVGFGIAILAVGCGGTDDRASQPPAASKAANVSLPTGRIAFRRYFDDAQTHGAIFTIRPDGTGERQITDPPAGHVDDQPDWSPDGTRIAFERCSEGKPCAVYTVAADRGRPQKVRARCELRPICDLAAPAWTPDGRLVVTLAQGRERMLAGEEWIQQSGLVLLDLARGTQKTIFERTNWSGDAGTPAVSPDGRTVVYRHWNSPLTPPRDARALFAVSIDGSGRRRIAPWELGGGDHPVFSPDGTILFRSFDHDERKQSDFWTVSPDGKDLEQLTRFQDGTLVRSASYSPDGRWIVHATNGVGGNADLYVMRSDGTGQRGVTRTELWDSAPDWGPMG